MSTTASATAEQQPATPTGPAPQEQPPQQDQAFVVPDGDDDDRPENMDIIDFIGKGGEEQDGGEDQPAPKAPEAPAAPAAPAQVPAAPAAPAAPVVAPPSTTTPVAPTPPTPPAPAVTPAAPTAPTAPAVQPTPTETQVPTQPVAPEQAPTAPDRAALRQQFLDTAERQYAIASTDVELLQTEPEKVLPKLAARLYADIYEGVLTTIFAQLPQLVTTINTARTQHEEREADFFKAWPELKEHKAILPEIGKMYRQLYPDADDAKAIQDVGAMAMMRLGLTRAPTAPTATPAPATVHPVPPPAPARAGFTAPAATTTQQPTNEFERLSWVQDADDED